MPKKKKSGKISRMTEEEKIAYEEQKRLDEEEMKKKKEDMLSQFLKDKLVKEERASKFNVNKLNHQWRNIMREAKSRNLKKDIEILSQTFERVIDRKDAVIKSLIKDIWEADEQYSMAFRSHVQNSDFLIDFQKHRLQHLEQDMYLEQEILREEFDTERAMLLEMQSREMTDITNVIYAMDQTFIDQETETKSYFFNVKDEIKNKNLEEKHSLRIQLEAKVDDLWQQFRVAMQNYQESTEDRRKAFEALKIKDEKSASEIDLQMKKLQRIADQIGHIKGKISANTRDCEQRNRFLKEEREIVHAAFQELKAQINKVRAVEMTKLTEMTLDSNAAIKELQRQNDKGEQILRVAEMCRKLETEEEKVLPFYTSSLTADEQSGADTACQQPPIEQLTAVMRDYLPLDNFWKRYNKVYLEKLALDKERQTLASENGRLRCLLKQYLDGISINDETFSQLNPLLIVNKRCNVKLNVPVGDPRVQLPPSANMMEAAHIVKHILPS